jgi:uncharacterized protein involved in exopolysaccharide biosynthesis
MISEAADRSPTDYLVAAWAFTRRALRATRLGALVFVVGLGITAVVILSAKRSYHSETVIMYDRGVRAGALVGGAELSDSPRQVLVRVQDMLVSRHRLRKAIEEFTLYPEIVAQHGYVDAVDEMRKQLKFSAHDGYTFRLSYDSESREQAQNVSIPRRSKPIKS